MNYESELTGGHPNSLGNTIKVVEHVIVKKNRINSLIKCYSSTDQIVRLRTSNAFKRIFRQKPEWFLDFKHIFLNKISKIKQSSTQWTCAQLFSELVNQLENKEQKKAKKIVSDYLNNSSDWIVLCQSMNALITFNKIDNKTIKENIKIIKKLSKDRRKAVSRLAKKLLSLNKKYKTTNNPNK
tara:strand:+ start:179 stop:727 length:549 start_codon:yes stop_codon:yes gene_type:complete